GDLGDLVEYLRATQRLHNRHFFGAGVACGLAVRAVPCPDNRRVSIAPGHALDCCGNDIVVPVAQELDVVKLASELRRTLLGVDCGDPCPPPKDAGKTPNPKAATQPVSPPDVGVWYELCVRYHEELTDFLSPYEFDGAPGRGCEASRVREGFAF